MNLQQLRCFVAAAQTGSFTRAADQLHTAQSALSRNIANLEQDLGVALFVRTGRGVELSPAGGSAFARATKLLDDLAAFSPAIAKFAATPTRQVALAAHGGLGSSFLPRVAGRLGITTARFSLAEGWSEHLEREVSGGDHDMAVVPRRTGFGVERAELESVRLASDDTVLLDMTGKRHGKSRTLSASRMLDLPLVVPPANSLERAAYESWARHHHRSIEVAGEATTLALRIELAVQLKACCLSQGVGLADLPHLGRWTAYMVKHDDFHRGVEWFAIHRRSNGDDLLLQVVHAIREEFRALAQRSGAIACVAAPA